MCRSVKYPTGASATISRFSVPKSVSLYLALNEDKVVEQLIAEAPDETMGTIEARMENKVRKRYQHDNRVSPNMVYAKFVHGESRPVDGIPDPHYHIHVFAMNATFDEVEKEWKALEVEVLQLWSRDLIGWLDAPAHGFGFDSFQVAAIRTRGHLAGGWLVPPFSRLDSRHCGFDGSGAHRTYGN